MCLKIVLLSLLIVALPIVVSDIVSHKIPNIYLKLMTVIAGIMIFIFGLGSIKSWFVTSVFLFLLLLVRTGMGDLKLIIVLLVYINPFYPFAIVDFCLIISLFGMVHLFIESLIHRRISREIALAPSIFLGFITYLATR